MSGKKNPDVTGIPVGLFDDEHSMQPIRSVWEDRRHDWVNIPTAVKHYPRGRVD